MLFKTKPLISIIVPVYNVEKYLNECIDSLLAQTYTNLEIILVDDQSPDNCPEICDKYSLIDNRIKVIHKKNEGLGPARNSGLEIAKGDLVAFVDSDDFVDIKMYETLFSVLNEFNLDSVYCGLYIYTKYNSKKCIETNDVSEFTLFENRDGIDTLLFNMIGSTPDSPKDVKYNMSVYRSLFLKKILDFNKIYFCSEKDFISEDIIFQIDFLTKSNRIGIIPNNLYYYRYNDLSLSRTYKPDCMERNVILYNEIKRRLLLLYDEKKFENNLDRMLMLQSRVAITQEIARIKIFEYFSGKKKVDIILKNKKLIEVLKFYPIGKLALKYRIYYLLVKYKFYLMLFLLTKVRIN